MDAGGNGCSGLGCSGLGKVVYLLAVAMMVSTTTQGGEPPMHCVRMRDSFSAWVCASLGSSSGAQSAGEGQYSPAVCDGLGERGGRPRSWMIVDLAHNCM